MSKESSDTPLFGRKKKGILSGGGEAAGNVVNLAEEREKRAQKLVRQKELTRETRAMKAILDELVAEPPWSDVDADSAVAAIARAKDSFHSGTPEERLLAKITTDEGKLRTAGPFVYYGLIEALEEQGLINTIKE